MCIEEESPEEQLSDEDELFVVYDVNAMVRSEISVPLKIENNDCHMQLDTGCAPSLWLQLRSLKRFVLMLKWNRPMLCCQLTQVKLCIPWEKHV